MVKRLIPAAKRSSGPTMQDIADRAGVSAATVSYVLNAKPGARVSQETRRRIRQVADELHYQPNAIARAMARGQSHTIGVYQPHAPGAPMSGMWASDVLRGIGEALHSNGFHLLLYGYREAEGPAPSAFLDGRSDGLIILAPHESDALPGALADRGHPVVITGGRHIEGRFAFSVDTDHVRGGALAVEHLSERGHRRIGLLQGPPGVPNAIDRRRGFEAGLLSMGLTFNPYWVVTSGFSLEGGKRALIELWKYPNRPTAICAANDVAAVGALEGCADLGIRVPDDLAIIGYDDTAVCEVTTPTLSSVRQNALEMGSASAARLLAALNGLDPPARTLLQPSLTIRRSTV
jgi:DNA-binding LacI/PurR family transcriptional regulator